MEYTSSFATPVEPHGAFMSFGEGCAPSLDSAVDTSIERPKKFVALDVDGTMFPDTTEFTGRMMDYLYENELLNDSTAGFVEGRAGARLRVNAAQAYEALREQYAASRTSHNLEVRKNYFLPLNTMHDRQIAGRKRSEVTAIADEVIRLSLGDMFRPIAEEIDLYKDDGVYVGLISGSPDFLVQALKRALNLDIATGTQLRKSGEGRYHLTAPSSPRGRDKHIIADGMRTRLSLDLLRRQGKPTTVDRGDGFVRPLHLNEIAPKDQFEFTAMYGDTLYDLSAMMEAKDPVVAYNEHELIAPVKYELYQYALAHGWRTLDVTATNSPPYEFQHIFQKAGVV